MKTLDNYTLEDLIKEAKKRFGSLHNFNRLTGRKTWALYNVTKMGLSRKYINKHRTSIYNDIIEFQPKSLKIKPIHRTLIYSRIHEKWHTVTDFCNYTKSDRYLNTNEEFNDQYISGVLNGKYTTITMKVRRLFKLLDIEI